MCNFLSLTVDLLYFVSLNVLFLFMWLISWLATLHSDYVEALGDTRSRLTELHQNLVKLAPRKQKRYTYKGYQLTKQNNGGSRCFILHSPCKHSSRANRVINEALNFITSNSTELIVGNPIRSEYRYAKSKHQKSRKQKFRY